MLLKMKGMSKSCLNLPATGQKLKIESISYIELATK